MKNIRGESRADEPAAWGLKLLFGVSTHHFRQMSTCKVVCTPIISYGLWVQAVAPLASSIASELAVALVDGLVRSAPPNRASPSVTPDVARGLATAFLSLFRGSTAGAAAAALQGAASKGRVTAQLAAGLVEEAMRAAQRILEEREQERINGRERENEDLMAAKAFGGFPLCVASLTAVVPAADPSFRRHRC